MFLLKAGEDNNYFFEENNNRKFYINSGLEKGPTIRTLVGYEVIVKYPKYWTPPNWNNIIRYFSKVETAKKVIFNELK